MTKMAIKTLRLPVEVIEAAQARALDTGLDLSDVLRRAIVRGLNSETPDEVKFKMGLRELRRKVFAPVADWER